MCVWRVPEEYFLFTVSKQQILKRPTRDHNIVYHKVTFNLSFIDNLP